MDSIQWKVSIGRLDVANVVMPLYGYRSVPRIGHMEQVKRVVGYLAKMKHTVIIVRIVLSDYYDIPHIEYN